MQNTHGAPADAVRHIGDLGNVQSASGLIVVDIEDSVASLFGEYSVSMSDIINVITAIIHFHYFLDLGTYPLNQITPQEYLKLFISLSNLLYSLRSSAELSSSMRARTISVLEEMTDLRPPGTRAQGWDAASFWKTEIVI